jgi:hypothetical protein
VNQSACCVPPSVGEPAAIGVVISHAGCCLRCLDNVSCNLWVYAPGSGQCFLLQGIEKTSSSHHPSSSSSTTHALFSASSLVEVDLQSIDPSSSLFQEFLDKNFIPTPPIMMIAADGTNDHSSSSSLERVRITGFVPSWTNEVLNAGLVNIGSICGYSSNQIQQTYSSSSSSSSSMRDIIKNTNDLMNYFLSSLYYPHLVQVPGLAIFLGVGDGGGDNNMILNFLDSAKGSIAYLVDPYIHIYDGYVGET